MFMSDRPPQCAHWQSRLAFSMSADKRQADTVLEGAEAGEDVPQSRQLHKQNAKRQRTEKEADQAPASAAEHATTENDHFPEYTDEEGSDTDTAFKTKPRVAAGGDLKATLNQQGPPPKEVLEEGKITFMYKPKVSKAEATSIDDVQRFYVLLEPVRSNTSGVSQATGVPEEKLQQDEQQQAGEKRLPGARLINIGKKSLPSATRHDRFFSFVSAVASTAEEVCQGMGEEHYSTKTRGERVQPAARVAGSGVYCICLHKKGTVLAYELELPTHLGNVQQELGIDTQGAFVLQVKNPEIKGEAGAPSAGPTPEFTATEKELFHGRRWIGSVQPAMLDKPGAELLLIGARADVKRAGVAEAAAQELDTLEKAHLQAAAAGAEPKEGAEGETKVPEGKAQQQLVQELEKTVGTQPEVGEAVKEGKWE